MADSGALGTLYPFLRGSGTDPAREHAGLLESVRDKALRGIQVKQAFFDANAERLIEAARAVAQVYRCGGRMFSMGNGGSSCDAAHFAVEFLHPVTAGRVALAAMNLAGDNAMLSAVGNDVGFEHVFVRQLIAHARSGDGLIGFSTSGNSVNLINAFAHAHERGLRTLALTGGDGGALAQSADVEHCLIVRTDSIHRVQECHVAAYHILWDLVHSLLAADRGGLQEAPIAPRGSHEIPG